MPKRSIADTKKVTDEVSEELLPTSNEEKDDLSDSEEIVYSGLEDEDDDESEEDEENENEVEENDEKEELSGAGSDGDDEEEEDNDEAEEKDSDNEEESDKENGLPSIEGLESDEGDDNEELKMKQTIVLQNEKLAPVKSRTNMPTYQATFEDVDTSDEEVRYNNVICLLLSSVGS